MLQRKDCEKTPNVSVSFLTIVCSNTLILCTPEKVIRSLCGLCLCLFAWRGWQVGLNLFGYQLKRQ